MESNHKFSQISSYNHKFGFDRSVLEYQQHNTLVSLPPSVEEEIKEINDISKEALMKKTRKKKSK